MMKDLPRISEAEWEVMKVLWASQEPAAANYIIEELSGRTDWKPKTIKTLIGRLVKKRAVGYREEGRSYHYFPLISEEECLKAESDSFLNRVYGGSLKPLLAHFLQEVKLTKEEIEELKEILDERKE